MRNTRRRAAGALGAVLLLAALPACSSDSGAAAGKSAPRTYELPARQVRSGEVPVHNLNVRSGDLAVTVIGLTTGIKEITGSHANFQPKGQFVRVRVVAVNRDRSTQILNTGKQRLVTSDGRTYKIDPNGMLIKRQPAESLDLGADMRIEFDLWYDVPAGSRPAALRIVGAASVGTSSDPPAADAKLPVG